MYLVPIRSVIALRTITDLNPISAVSRGGAASATPPVGKSWPAG
jgi:hypothetical protein